MIEKSLFRQGSVPLEHVFQNPWRYVSHGNERFQGSSVFVKHLFLELTWSLLEGFTHRAIEGLRLETSLLMFVTNDQRTDIVVFGSEMESAGSLLLY
jgi:hypothetical protein